MSVKQPELRRYLVDVDTVSTQQIFTDVLVIGAGIAGLFSALEAAKTSNVTLISKDKLEMSNTWYAQGGIASVLNRDDTIEKHVNDTIKTGCGLCNKKIVELVISKGPELIGELLALGTQFDLEDDGSVSTTLEAGHSKSRVAHAHGDSTGKWIAGALIDRLKEHPNINYIENFFAIDLITNSEQRCLGVIGNHEKFGREIIWAPSTILATGGAGILYRETTNPNIATGDGMAMAYRAGAVLRDMEFMQFHPTTLYIAGASRVLMTEALRGEGATLLDSNGYRFMFDYNSAGELAPRDIVSRSILEQMRKTDSTHVYLDVRHFEDGHFQKRFPFIGEICKSFDIDPQKDLIPVRPSAHYMIGGVKTDENAKTNLAGLWACGEVASTGLHGANRLASNSLLEGLVFGKIAADAAVKNSNAKAKSLVNRKIFYNVKRSSRSRLDTEDVRNSLRALMWRNVGITRAQESLSECSEIILFWQRYVMDKIFDSPDGWECQNMLAIALLMAEAAQQRLESRGVHHRDDYPNLDEACLPKHIEQLRPDCV